MVTLLLTAQLSPHDAGEAVSIADRLGYQARQIGGQNSGLILVEAMIIDEDADIAVQQEQVRTAVTTGLTQHGIPHQVVGIGADESSVTKSTFTIRRIGDVEGENDLTIRADDRGEFEQRLTALHDLLGAEDWPPQDLAGCEVTVEGLAAGDADVQQPPYRPNRP